ncbi:hypothetical protein IDSA_06975 [Pseudidiomarina salinarum]|uniref:DUF6671 domain-containing protein n=1 Tax=Pseudidiomarina salinarum TaxID=435908 RepID=A0A094JE55_9GAMM|nr:DUF6671 family protein [Pseudidiomarina salinarum]KFZ30821.1 hypothetical protein IDSA_06975 [Pseudidiomarina salinarum]RUO71290.1 hypothetical protein CWI79_07660 [Pseudidiomarina salinarum]
MTRYEPQQVALLTKHGKAQWIAPELANVGLAVVPTEAFDTDLFGTFSGEQERTASPLECAKRKAALACELTGLRLGLGSEGSFGGGPMPGLMNWDQEILVLYDASQDFYVTAVASAAISLRDFSDNDLPELTSKLAQFASGQAWMVHTDKGIFKDMYSASAIYALLREHNLWDGEKFYGEYLRIQPDYRAMNCPERQRFIASAAAQLRERLLSLCPECGEVNFWLTDVRRGLPCQQCGLPTELTNKTIKSCSACDFTVEQPVAEKYADPMHCQVCNP